MSYSRFTAIAWCATAATLISPGCTTKPNHADFGELMKLKPAQTIPVAAVFQKAPGYDGRYIRVTGRVASVCPKKGCWIRIGADGTDETLLVKFTCPVGTRLIPLDAVGHDVVVEGTLKTERITQADARHYAEDAGESPHEIAKIVGPQRQLHMASPAARITGLE